MMGGKFLTEKKIANKVWWGEGQYEPYSVRVEYISVNMFILTERDRYLCLPGCPGPRRS